MNRKPKILVVGSFVMDLIVSTEKFPGSGETVLGKRREPGRAGSAAWRGRHNGRQGRRRQLWP